MRSGSDYYLIDVFLENYGAGKRKIPAMDPFEWGIELNERDKGMGEDDPDQHHDHQL